MIALNGAQASCCVQFCLHVLYPMPTQSDWYMVHLRPSCLIWPFLGNVAAVTLPDLSPFCVFIAFFLKWVSSEHAFEMTIRNLQVIRFHDIWPIPADYRAAFMPLGYFSGHCTADYVDVCSTRSALRMHGSETFLERGWWW